METITKEQLNRIRRDIIKEDVMYAYSDILHKYKSTPEVMDLITKYLPLLDERIKGDEMFAYIYIMYKYKGVPEVEELMIKHLPGLVECIKGGEVYAYQALLQFYKDITEVYNTIKNIKIKVKSLT